MVDSYRWLRELFIRSRPKPREDIHCPVCGYYCLGKGGYGCIDKPFLYGMKAS